MKELKIDKFVNEIENKREIDTKQWREFDIDKIFNCETAKQILKVEDGEFPYITRSSFNNGLTKFVKKINNKINEKNCITIGAEGLYAFYQENEFMAGNKIYVLRNDKLNKFNALFVCAILNSIVGEYSYSNARILNKIKLEKHKFPVDNKGNVDWDYMENYSKDIYRKFESVLN